MQLQEIHSARLIEPEPSTAMEIDLTATLIDGDAPDRFPFIYRPDDRYGLNPEVTSWLMSNPEFPIEPYEGHEA